jgi:ribonuclease D
VNHWLNHPDELTQRLQAWRGIDTVALDTEFIRERTYFPQLALVQLGIRGETLLVDPLVPGMTEALRPLLADPATTKLMHSASEDLQALLRGCETLPAPMFDTQVAAALAGLGAGLGYQKLVEQVTGIALDKGQTRSDWLRRPLSDEQLHYAAEDVVHLHAIHDELSGRLQALGRLDWLQADCERALRLAGADTEDPYPHLTLRSAQSLDEDAQARLCRLLRWRDSEARRTDRPKGWILDNELAVALSRRPPDDFHRFQQLLDSSPKSPRKSRAELWALIESPLSDAERSIPIVRSEQLDKQRLKALQEAVATLAQSLNLPEGLLCARKHLETLLEGRGWPDALLGWRRELLEPALAPLLT